MAERPSLLALQDYATKAAKRMFPDQKGVDDQQDAARHMLAAGLIAQRFGRFGPAVAKAAGVGHEIAASPLVAFRSLGPGGAMPLSYTQDTHNNALGAQLGAMTDSPAELEELVRKVAAQSVDINKQRRSENKPWIGKSDDEAIERQTYGYAMGGAVQFDPVKVRAIVDEFKKSTYAMGGVVSQPVQDENNGYAEGGLPRLPADRATGFKQPGAQPDDRLARFGGSFVSSLPGAAQNVATGYWDMLSALNTYLYQLEPEEQISALKKLPAGVREMVLRGVESAKQLPERVAAATPESAGQFGAQLTAEMLLDPARLGKGVPKAEIIKKPGGNWEAGSVERVVDKIKPQGPTNRDEALVLGGTWTQRVDTPVGQEMLRQNATMSDWLDKKLKTYIKNDMATERDPVRLGIEQRLARAQEEKAKADLRNAKTREKISAARAQGKNTTAAERQLEQDIVDAEQKYKLDQVAASHMRLDPQTIAANQLPSENLIARRISAGAPTENLATTGLSTFWEKRADLAFGIPKDAGDAVDPNFWLEPEGYENFMRNNPWAVKVPPNTKIYGIQPNSERALQFDHLRDELEFALYDHANLPPELQLTPEDLSKMNMDAAVAHVGKMNAWRERNKIAADLLKSRNAATVTFKEYPEAGLEWKELKMPGENQGGRATLEEALGYEGDVMGHCVGGRGYCDKVISGEGQIFSLRDAKGEPHVTIEVRPSTDTFARAKQAIDTRYPDLDENDKMRMLHDAGYVDDEGVPTPDPLPEILQIKGKGNLKPADKYLPFVQDFVRSQKWGNVKDLYNADMNRLDQGGPQATALRSRNIEPPRYITKEQKKALDDWIDSGKWLERGTLPKGFAHGGAVQTTTQFDPARVQDIIKNFQEVYNA